MNAIHHDYKWLSPNHWVLCLKHHQIFHALQLWPAAVPLGQRAQLCDLLPGPVAMAGSQSLIPQNGWSTNTSKRWLEHYGKYIRGLLFWFEIRPTLRICGSNSKKCISVTDSPPFLLCFQENLELEQLGITPCAHYFCLPCLTQQVERNQRCGVCRHPLKSLGLSSLSGLCSNHNQIGNQMGRATWVPDEMVWIMDLQKKISPVRNSQYYIPLSWVSSFDHVDERCTPPVHTHTARRTHHNISNTEILKHVYIYIWHIHMICINYIFLYFTIHMDMCLTYIIHM